jgi:hypothetical protein
MNPEEKKGLTSHYTGEFPKKIWKVYGEVIQDTGLILTYVRPFVQIKETQGG